MDQQKCIELRQQIDQLIKAGDGDQAKKELVRISIPDIPRSERFHFAQLCRRTGLINSGLKMLSKIIREDQEGMIEARLEEKAEYGVLLQRLGAVDEAKKLLNEIVNDKIPSAYLYLAFCNFNQWNYREAIDPLKKYLELIDDNSYAYLVGQVNLAAALVNIEKNDEAGALLDRIIAINEKLGNKLLLGNCYEIKSQLQIQLGRYGEAKKLLDKSEKSLQNNQLLEKFFIYKWRTIAEAFESPKKIDWNELRKKARHFNHSESIREIDYHEAIIGHDLDLALKVLFGTPFYDYRKKLLNKLPMDVPSFYRMGAPSPLEKDFDLLLGSYIGAREVFKLGSILHRLFCTLVNDFYRPKRIGALFSHLYPDEYFDPHSSPDRVHQILKRFRSSIQKDINTIELRHTNNTYHVEFSQQFSVWLPFSYPELSKNGLIKTRIEREWTDRRFTRRQFQNLFSLEYTAANTKLNELVSDGFIERMGSGRSTVYCIKKDPRGYEGQVS